MDWLMLFCMIITGLNIDLQGRNLPPTFQNLPLLAFSPDFSEPVLWHFFNFLNGDFSALIAFYWLASQVIMAKTCAEGTLHFKWWWEPVPPSKWASNADFFGKTKTLQTCPFSFWEKYIKNHYILKSVHTVPSIQLCLYWIDNCHNF